MAKKRLLITGGSGFIGRNLREGLSSQYDILAPGHKELDLLDDEAVRQYLRGHPVDAVIHGATTPGHRNAKNVENLAYKNIRMFFNIARNADCYGKMIQLGSGAEYDMRHYLPKMTEDYFGRHVPVDEHGFSKYVCSQYAESAGRIVNLRLFGVFGKYEDYEIRFISNAICKALTGRAITLKQDRRFDYLFVEDLAPIVAHFIENDASRKTYNATPDEAVSLRTLAELVREVSGKKVDIVAAAPGLGTEYSGDNGRLRAEIPGLRLTPIREAVRRLYAWYAENAHAIQEEALLADK